jgi:hypothetical protein
VLVLRLVLALMMAAPLGALAAAQPASPAKDEQPAAPAPNAESSEPFQVDGFRSAHWGMTDAQVKAAIRKDFNIPRKRCRPRKTRASAPQS